MESLQCVKPAESVTCHQEKIPEHQANHDQTHASSHSLTHGQDLHEMAKTKTLQSADHTQGHHVEHHASQCTAGHGKSEKKLKDKKKNKEQKSEHKEKKSEHKKEKKLHKKNKCKDGKSGHGSSDSDSDCGKKKK